MAFFAELSCVSNKSELNLTSHVFYTKFQRFFSEITLHFFLQSQTLVTLVLPLFIYVFFFTGSRKG